MSRASGRDKSQRWPLGWLIKFGRWPSGYQFPPCNDDRPRPLSALTTFLSDNALGREGLVKWAFLRQNIKYHYTMSPTPRRPAMIFTEEQALLKGRQQFDQGS